MKTFIEWTNEQERLSEGFLQNIALAGGLAAGALNYAGGQTANAQPNMVQQQHQIISLDQLRQATAQINGDQIIIKYIPSTTFGKDWKFDRNRAENEKLLKDYTVLAQNKFKVKIGGKEDVKYDGKFLIWTLKLN